MFAKNKVSQSMIDAVNSVINEGKIEEASEKVPTPTGMKVYGSSYGNSKKARADQSKSSVDDLKGPKTKELLQKDKEEHEKTKGKYDEAAKPDYLDFDKDGDKKEPMKSALSAKKKVAEELKGNQHKIDKNKNNKIDAHDFKILRGEKKVSEESEKEDSCEDEAKREVKKHEKKLHGKAGEVSKHVAKLHKENVFYRFAKELQENKTAGTDPTFTDNNIGEMSDKQMAKREKIVKSMKKGTDGFKDRYGAKWKNVMYATATKQAMKEDSSDEWDGEFLEEETPKKNQDVADKAYLKHKPGTVKGTLTQLGRFVRGKPEIKEDFVDESVQTQPSKTADKITTDTLAGRVVGGKLNSFKNYKVDLTTSGTEAVPKEFDVGVDAKDKQKHMGDAGKPLDIKMDDKLSTPPQKYFSSDKKTTSEAVEEVDEVVIHGMPGFKKIKGADDKGNVTDKSGAVHTPMSRAKDAAKLTFKKLKQEMLGKIAN